MISDTCWPLLLCTSRDHTRRIQIHDPHRTSTTGYSRNRARGRKSPRPTAGSRPIVSSSQSLFIFSGFWVPSRVSMVALRSTTRAVFLLLIASVCFRTLTQRTACAGHLSDFHRGEACVTRHIVIWFCIWRVLQGRGRQGGWSRQPKYCVLALLHESQFHNGALVISGRVMIRRVDGGSTLPCMHAS